MSDHLHIQNRYQSLATRIDDVVCRTCETACGDEEHSDAHTIVFPRSGFFMMHKGRQRIVADANQAIFFNSDEPYRVSHPIPGGDDCTALTIPCDSLTDVLRDIDRLAPDRQTSLFPFSYGPMSAKSIFLLHTMRQWLARPSCDVIAIEEAAMALVGATVSAAFAIRGQRSVRRRASTNRVHDDTTSRVKALLTDRFSTRLTIEEIAKKVACSPYHLCRVFRRVAGMPIHQYLNSLRLRASLERMAGGATDLTNLAFDVGFSSHAHLTDAFKRAFCTTPSAFKKHITTSNLRQMSKNLEA